MAVLFDFGLSQEDPLSERRVLDLTPGDRILSVASGGEVPLTLMSLIESLQVTAVDISKAQIRLCRLKITAATQLPFPQNGQFLGFAPMVHQERLRLYDECIRPNLDEQDGGFWDMHRKEISKGIINAGRFEGYIANLRMFTHVLIGKRNLQRLTECSTMEEQKLIFSQKIATRKSLQALFKIAFHPAVYKKRGLDEQALIHADQSTGKRFYSKFEFFCTFNPASENYFLQYFLLGGCITLNAYPEYLKPENKVRLINNLMQLELKTLSFREALLEKERGYFNKIHLSNLGDWSTPKEFSDLRHALNLKCTDGTRICSRHLQKNQFTVNGAEGFYIDKVESLQAESRDRFPFYGILSILFNPVVVSQPQTNE
jgi:S-adenosylmethionine-diacylglycerol 3-amino-3-carboxypropyl transferase